jgi:hypothetical protein
VPAENPVAALGRVPIVAYAAEDGPTIGIDVAALAGIAPEAVYRNADGAPDGIRQAVVQAYLVAAVGALDRRLRQLEGQT